MVFGYELGKAFVRLLQERLPVTEKVDKLFGLLLAAVRPQAASLTAGQNYAIVIFFSHSNEKVGCSRGKGKTFFPHSPANPPIKCLKKYQHILSELDAEHAAATVFPRHSCKLLQ